MNYERRILITGGAGNVGGSLARRLVEDKKNLVVVVDNLLTGSISNLPSKEQKNFRFVRADVNDITSMMPIFTRHGFDYVFHYAAVVGVQRTLANPKWVLNDIDGIRNILDLAKNTGVTRVFFSSSSEVYGEPVELPQREATTPLNSRLPYAIVKNVGEAYFKSYKQEYDLDYTIFRFFNTYGPLQSEDFVISKFINLAMKGAPIDIYGDGQQTRTFCYVKDNVDCIERILVEDLAINEVLNIGSDVEITILDLAKMVIKCTSSKSELRYLPPLPEGDMTRRCPDISMMMKCLGRPLTPLTEGIQNCMEFATAA